MVKRTNVRGASRPRALIIGAVVLLAVVLGVLKVSASGLDLPPLMGTPPSKISSPPADAVGIPGVDHAVTGSFGMELSSPVGHGDPLISSEAAATRANDHPDAWTVVGKPVLAWATHRRDLTQTSSCLCWVVHLHSDQGVETFGPAGQPHPRQHGQLLFVDAHSGAVDYVLSGGEIP